MKNNDKAFSKLLLTVLLGCASSTAMAQPCTGVPAIGQATAASLNIICSGMPQLSLSSYPSETGITYQWQASPHGQNNFQNVGGALQTPEYNAELINTSTDYRVIATCTGSAMSDTSDTLTILVDNSPTNITADPGNVNMICPGVSTMLTGTATAAGSGPTYQWLMNGNTILTDGGVYSGTTSNTLMISDAGDLNNNTYQIIAIGCTVDTSAVATITVNTANTWTGAVSNLWSDAGNWGSCGVPTYASDVTIPASAANQPIIDSAWANTLTIESGASVTFASGFSGLRIRSNITNNGTFDATNSTVEFGGTTTQNIPGGTYANITISGGGEKVLSDDVTVTDILTLGLGFITLWDNHLVLGSPELTIGGDANAYIITNGLGTVKGMDMDATDSVTFHVGPTSLLYNPLGFRNNGTMDNFSVRVMENVYVDGSGMNTAEVMFPVVDRTWMVTEDVAGGSIATMSPYWHETDMVNGFDPSWVYVIHHNGTMWHSLMDSTLTGMPAVGSGPYYTTATNVTTFSPFSVGSGNQFPLTIQLADIKAVNMGATNKIDWVSVDEDMGDKYELQRSENGRSFTTIATINAKGESSDYVYYDKQPAKGVNYYRLLMTSNTGKVEYSKVVTAVVGSADATTVSVFPNPVNETLTLSVNGVVGKGAALVTDIAGKVVSSVNVTNNTTDINMSSLAPGVYFIKYQDEATKETIRVIKK